jgi:acetyltransferase-like isoleucine patch superfamily enzyme
MLNFVGRFMPCEIPDETVNPLPLLEGIEQLQFIRSELAQVPLEDRNKKNKSTIYEAQHKERLNYMPWLYYSLKPQQKSWAQAWQANIKLHWQSLETVRIGENCFIADSARLFAEPNRPIIIGDNCSIAADCVLHGPITLGDGSSLNHHTILDGGRVGISIGQNCRIAAYTSIYAFNHGMDADRLIKEQPVSSQGVKIGNDVWIGAHCAIVDGITIGDHAVVGIRSVVTHSVEPNTKVAGNPAKLIGFRN